MHSEYFVDVVANIYLLSNILNAALLIEIEYFLVSYLNFNNLSTSSIIVTFD